VKLTNFNVSVFISGVTALVAKYADISLVIIY
jgi:hypothetical protein